MRDVVQPDLMFVSIERLDIIAENNVVDAPDFIVEILSDSTKNIDGTSKKSLYERYGVKEYWIVDPTEKTIKPFILKEQNLELNEAYQNSQSIMSSVIKGFELSVDTMFSN